MITGTQPRVVRARTPLRVSLGGGGTDIAPYSEDHGGVALTLAITRYAYATLTANTESDAPFRVDSRDLGIVDCFTEPADLALDGRLDLAKAAIQRLAPNQLRAGLELTTHSDARPGSGLGGSSAMTATILGALAHHAGRHPDADELAALAFEVERHDVGIAGGRQDQYACVFGGCNFIQFSANETIVQPLQLAPAVREELERSMLLCDTGMTRDSSQIIERHVAAYERRDDGIKRALDGIKAAAIEMKAALRGGRFATLGDLIDHSWQQKQRLDPAITAPMIDYLYDTARRAGAYGGKLLGAGGGGYVLLVVPPERRQHIEEQLIAAGGTPLAIAIADEGFAAWDAHE